MESYAIYIAWVSDISRAGCLVFDDWPFCSRNATNEGLRNWQQEQSAITGCEITGQIIIDPRQWTRFLTEPSLWFRARCAMMATAPEKWLCVSAFFLRLVPVSSPLHFSWELMTPVMPLKRFQFFFPPFSLFSERHLLSSLILNPIPVCLLFIAVSFI